MKLQSPTLILVFLAIALGAFVAVTEFRSAGSSDSDESQSLFEFEEEEVRALVVEKASQTLTFEKENGSGSIDADGDLSDESADEPNGESTSGSDNNGIDGPVDGVSASEEGENSEQKEADVAVAEWWMRSPDEVPADESAVIFLVNLMASGVSDRVFQVEPKNLDDFGFASPLAEVEVTLDNNESHRLILGNYDFNGTNIYAQAISSGEENEQEGGVTTDGPSQANEQNPTDSETVDVFIVSTSFDSAVNRPLEEWKQADEDNTEEPPAPASENSEDTDVN
ncbi:MAG: DUF4340 domain-containing protein [Cyanobacteria bacterium P01_F01_bin.150]